MKSSTKFDLEQQPNYHAEELTTFLIERLQRRQKKNWNEIRLPEGNPAVHERFKTLRQDTLRPNVENKSQFENHGHPFRIERSTSPLSHCTQVFVLKILCVCRSDGCVDLFDGNAGLPRERRIIDGCRSIFKKILNYIVENKQERKSVLQMAIISDDSAPSMPSLPPLPWFVLFAFFKESLMSRRNTDKFCVNLFQYIK